MATKYFFGYIPNVYNKAGIPAPVKWMEDSGSVVGPTFIIDPKNTWELTKLQFEGTLLATLIVQYPYKVGDDLTQSPSDAILLGKLKEGKENVEPNTPKGGAQEPSAEVESSGQTDPKANPSGTSSGS